MDLTDAEIRVLGCLVEKQRLTPDAYPLSLNSLRLATNQSTSRDPVVDYDEATIRDALDRLYRRRWARLASTSGRSSKYRHLLDDALGLPEGELAVLTVLMLRGIQTPGELRARTERMHHFADAAAVETALAGLTERERDVLRLRYGFVDSEPKTLEYIGRCLGLTRERVRQIESEALSRLARVRELESVAG